MVCRAFMKQELMESTRDSHDGCGQLCPSTLATPASRLISDILSTACVTSALLIFSVQFAVLWISNFAKWDHVMPLGTVMIIGMVSYVQGFLFLPTAPQGCTSRLHTLIKKGEVKQLTHLYTGVRRMLFFCANAKARLTLWQNECHSRAWDRLRNRSELSLALKMCRY